VGRENKKIENDDNNESGNQNSRTGRVKQEAVAVGEQRGQKKVESAWCVQEEILE
jgi:hypothetical protein